MVDILFPRLSDDDPQAEGVVATWLVADGDPVTAGQTIGEVMVEKVSAEVSAPAAGRIHLLVPEEGVTRQGQPIARLD